ncbi:MAG: hypothetical protein K2M43_00340 [Mycoplasmoidaceae bacterium]|nr:hypothetical protein [Mycoplasmoidaceae bacterium]
MFFTGYGKQFLAKPFFNNLVSNIESVGFLITNQRSFESFEVDVGSLSGKKSVYTELEAVLEDDPEYPFVTIPTIHLLINEYLRVPL